MKIRVIYMACLTQTLIPDNFFKPVVCSDELNMSQMNIKLAFAKAQEREKSKMTKMSTAPLAAAPAMPTPAMLAPHAPAMLAPHAPTMSAPLPQAVSAADYIETPWSVIGSYFRGGQQRLVRHQIESYNNFVQLQIHKTIAMFNQTKIRSDLDYDAAWGKHSLEVEVCFDGLKIFSPQLHENSGATRLMYPNIAREVNGCYSSNLTLNMKIKYLRRTGDQLEKESVSYVELPGINIGKLPIMVHSQLCLLEQYKHLSPTASGECRLDPGGYFIINGSEKTCLGQERAAENLVQCFNVSKSSGKWSFLAEIKSVPDFKCISPKQVTLMLAAKHNGVGYPLMVEIPRVKTAIPLFVLFRALGVVTDKAMCEHVVLDAQQPAMQPMLHLLLAALVDANPYPTQEAALAYITAHVMYTPMHMDKETGAQKKREFALDILHNDVFPHCQSLPKKLLFLGYMTLRLLQCKLGLAPVDDRDSFVNKRIDLTGPLLNNLFRNYFNKMVKDMQKQIVREINTGSWRSKQDYNAIVNMTNIYKIVKADTIENGLKRALSTGDFGVKHNNSSKVGVAQVLNRLTYLSSISHLRRFSTPLDKTSKLVAPRKLHPTTWGYLCPAETPEGASVGVVKNMSYMTHVTIASNSATLYEYTAPYITAVDGVPLNNLYNAAKLFVNGAWLGVVADPWALYSELKRKKLKGIINIYTSIVFDTQRKEIRLCNDAGRLTRPLLLVQKNQLRLNTQVVQQLDRRELTWDELLTDTVLPSAVIEYLDPAEQNAALVAMTPTHLQDAIDTASATGTSATGTRELDKLPPQYTHCEIHPSTIFGVLASCIPFPEHNQSPRNTYQCAMGKQSIGIPLTNFDVRMDKTAYVLTTPMRPLVDTRLMNFIKLNTIPSGCQVVVAIMTHTGYNQEDSVLINQGAIDRGLFHATIYHTEKDEDKKMHGEEEIRCKPDVSKTKGMKFGNYEKLNSEGLLANNTLVENRDVIIGKVVAIKEARNDLTTTIKFEDHSRVYRTTEPTYVDKTLVKPNGDGYFCCKIRLRASRKPAIGDKFSSRHGQKGTVGNVIPEADMPFTAAGIRPDIIINPHAIPSRMTIAQLKETLLGKLLLQLGLFGDGTSFGKLDVDDIRQQLHELGQESTGNELLYNGLTGEQIEAAIFMGPVFYQRLKHMVADKQHSRSIGPMMGLTRQPAEGRSKDGGLRFGEMERDCMCSHGAANFTKGRVYDASDAFQVHVCNVCGLMVAYNPEQHIYLCKTCENRTDFSAVDLPYSCKLLFQELQTINVVPRILV